MSTEKHSAGPWTWSGTGYILGGPEGRNAICEPFGRDADARLIAAAPALLAACKAMLDAADGSFWDDDGITIETVRAEEAIGHLRAAIASAEGGAK